MYISTHRAAIFSLSRQNLRVGGLYKTQVVKQLAEDHYLEVSIMISVI